MAASLTLLPKPDLPLPPLNRLFAQYERTGGTRLHKGNKIARCCNSQMAIDLLILGLASSARTHSRSYYGSKLAFQRQLDSGKVIVTIKASPRKHRL